LVALLCYIRDGDTVVVVALDRLGRSLSGVIRTIESLTEAGMLLKSLRAAAVALLVVALGVAVARRCGRLVRR
jgi:DNA invertase Pin-like site-specific DNA recombinase